MKNNSDYKYITVPLSVIKRIYTNPKSGISDIFDVGIYKVSTFESVDTLEAIKQLFYCYYREKDSIPYSLCEQIEDLISNETITMTDDFYCGFDGLGSYDPAEAIDELLYYIGESNSVDLLDEIKEFHALRAVKNILNISFDTKSVMRTAKSILDDISGKEPLVTIKTEMMFDYYKNEKTAYEKDLFACYLGIRSILGKSEFAYTTREMIRCRMVGCKSPHKLTEALKCKQLKKIYESYSKPYRMTKLLDNLVYSGFISKIAIKPLRRTYISTQLSMDELEKAIIIEHNDGKLRKVKQNERNAASRILNAII